MKNPRLLELLRTTTDTCANLTGSWRYFRPVFEERHPPCAAVCPAGNDIREFMRLAAEGDPSGALAAIKQENPLPSVCGRVCHHPCTEACSRNQVDEPLAVNLIERHLGDLALESGLCLPEPGPATGKSVAVVGSGPAGLACAYHAALLGHKATIFESGPEPGGMLRRGIPAYRLPREALDADLSFIAALGIELKTNQKIKSLDELSGFDAACLCPGAHAGRPLDVPGAEARGVWAGLEFLEDINAGDRPDVGGKAVVIGGGNTAVDCARAALRLGAGATVLYRREEGDMPALPDEIAEAREEGVAFEFLAMPLKIIERDGCVHAVECLRTKPGEPGPDGRRRPEPVPGSGFTVPADAVIVAVGESPDSAWLPGELLKGNGVMKAGPVTLQVRDGLFTAGDAAGDGRRTVSNAIGTGKRVALAIDLYLKEELDRAAQVLAAVSIGDSDALSARAYREGGGGEGIPVVPADAINVVTIEPCPGPEPVRLKVEKRVRGFDEVNAGLESDAAAREAGRCLRCGSCTTCGICLLFCPDMSVVLAEGVERPEFDYDYCKGCGICERECPRAVIEMIEEEK